MNKHNHNTFINIYTSTEVCEIITLILASTNQKKCVGPRVKSIRLIVITMHQQLKETENRNNHQTSQIKDFNCFIKLVMSLATFHMEKGSARTCGKGRVLWSERRVEKLC